MLYKITKAIGNVGKIKQVVKTRKISSLLHLKSHLNVTCRVLFYFFSAKAVISLFQTLSLKIQNIIKYR